MYRNFATRVIRKPQIDPVILVRSKLRLAKQQVTLHVAPRPSAPKQAYLLFSQDERANSPELFAGTAPAKERIASAARELSQRYRNLSPDRQATYASIAAANTATYKTDLEAWKKSLGEEQVKMLKRVKYYKRKLDKMTGQPKKMTRQSPATMAYIEYFRSKARDRPQDIKVTEWAKQIGSQWNALSAQEKAHWRQVASIQK